MAFFKWFARIKLLQAEDRKKRTTALPPFDFASLKPRTLWAKATAALFGSIFQYVVPPILRLCQRFWPIPIIPGLNLVIVTRDDDVRFVLDDQATFGVPYGPEMCDLGDGTTFGLGLDGPGHRRQRQIMAEVMWDTPVGQGYYGHDLNHVLEKTRRYAEALIDGGAGRIDVIRDFVTRIATETAADYFGIDIDDPDAFAEWSLAASCLLFGDMGGSRETRDLALNGAARLRLVIHNSIARAQRNRADHPGSSGRKAAIIDRLVQLQYRRRKSRDPISDDEITALLMGMVTGFVPTNTLAGAKMLAELLARPDQLVRAVDAATKPDFDTMRGILKEAARLNSALAPGQWRFARKDGVIAAGTRRERRVKQGTILLVSTMTALRDPARFDQPNRFRTDRGIEGDLMFGWGPHRCMGAHMAIEQITTMFMVLFAQPDLRVAPGAEGRMEYTGVFPTRLDMTYGNVGAMQSMFLVIAPVPLAVDADDAAIDAKKKKIDAVIGRLGNPAVRTTRRLLDDSGVVHFASISTIVSSRGLDIVTEFSVDGEPEPALASIAEHAEVRLRPIYALAGLGDDEPFAQFLFDRIVKLACRPWGATGLDYNGLSEFPIGAIEKQRALADLAGRVLQDFLSRKSIGGTRAMQALTYVRRIIRGDRFQQLRRRGPQETFVRAAAEDGLDAFILKPSRATLKLANYKQPSRWGAFFAVLVSRDGLAVTVPALLLFFVAAFSLSRAVALPPLICLLPHLDWWAASQGRCVGEAALFARTIWGWLALVAGALMATLGMLAAMLSVAIWILRRHEIADQPEPSQASLKHFEQIARFEDRPGYAQNHFMAVGQLKPGIFRMLVHTFALWAIRLSIVYYFRPGFVTTMGTIHYARWWRLPGTQTGVFFSNYDGSWESYLEDFITRVSWGQTAAWSNWVGFPRTRFLILNGAEDGARFKRWVRTQQRIAPFWYTRLPDLTADQIRTNALIHHGLARARTDTDAREWLRCFGSMPRVENRVESDEVQSIVFSGIGALEHSCCLAIRLPAAKRSRLGAWLALISGEGLGGRGLESTHSLRTGWPDAFAGDDGRRLSAHMCVAFGDRQVMGEEPVANKDAVMGLAASRMIDRQQYAAFFGCSAAGFRKLAGGVGRNRDTLLDDLPGNFSLAFQMGMTNRHRTLGDVDDAAPEHWRWGDTDKTGTGVAVEAVLMLYASSKAKLGRMAAFHTSLLEEYGGAIVHRRDCAPGSRGPNYEHFGFRDGLSQPVMRDTERFARGAPARDIVATGEFVLGYADNQGYLPPSPKVRAEADKFETLPLASVEEISRYPDFGANQSAALPRDFGRNGTYMVIREITQHVDVFNAFADAKAAELMTTADSAEGGQHGYRELFNRQGLKPTSEWIKAKIVGRWPNGRPLVGNASSGPLKSLSRRRATPDEDETMAAISRRHAELDNDFAYGIDDPQGFACPFGAHVRRANPRDSKEPGDAQEQAITNRHRLLRRGRSYTIDEGETGSGEKGLLFVALCADIERQFEFVQQTWVNAPAFHSLTNEPDPLVGVMKGSEKCFTIPTPAGPLRLTGIEPFTQVRGGGYFFLPSRAALLFLRDVTSLP